MAEISLAELQAIRSDFNNLDKTKRPELSAGQCVYREYTFASAAKFPSYYLTPMDDQKVISTFNSITKKEYSAMTESDLLDLVTAAVCVKHPTRADLIMVTPWQDSVMCDDWKSAKPSTVNSVSMKRGHSGIVQATIVPASTAADMDTQVTEEPAATQASAICFLFAWLTRYAVKSPSIAINLQYENLKESYMKFYQRSSTIFNKFTPDSSWVSCLRNAFDAFSRVKNTLVMYVAAAETSVKSDSKSFNLLRYLFFQHLEFMGMHAYVSIVTITNKVALPPGLILTWLRMSGSEMAIDEAHRIMSVLDNGMIKDGHKAERLWKYARLLDAGFFNRLQTSYSAELVATLAYIEIKLGLASEVGYSSPLNIFAIANNKHIKEVGQAKAEAFIECKNSMISLSSDASVVDKIYAKKRGMVAEAAPSEKQQAEASEPARKKRAPPTVPNPGFL